MVGIVVVELKRVASPGQFMMEIRIPFRDLHDTILKGEQEYILPTGERLHLSYRTSLVVAPASVVHNWRNELSRFAPSLSLIDSVMPFFL